MRILQRISSVLSKWPVKIIFSSFLLIILLALGAQQVRMATGNDTLVSSDTKVYKDNVMLEEEFGGESIIVLYEADSLDKLLKVSNLEHMKELENRLQSKDEIFSIISAATIVEQMTDKQSEKYQEGISEVIDGLDEMGSKLTETSEKLSDMQNLGAGFKEMGENLNSMLTYSDTMKPGLPQSQDTLEHLIYEDGKLRDMFSELIIGDQYMMMVIKFQSGVSDESKSEVVALIQSYLVNEPLENTETMVSGKPVLDVSIRTSMKESMQKMMMLSILFMIIVLSFFFKVRWRILPLGIILVAVVGTVGLMGWTGIPITMVSMAVFPILIGLGIDYAIQFQSRYTEEMMEGATNNE